MPEEQASAEPPKPLLKIFSGKAAAGVRIRKGPSLIVNIPYAV